ncbi:MAG: ferrochelatase [Salinivirgaceae bacterium]|nr:MAG: ferrochelatase [Salinivirgaceae bacterium]
MTRKKALIIVNTGTPDSPTVRNVRKYLFQFLNDKRVIDLPWLGRFLLVNLIIVPFRAPKSTKLYKRLWTKDGSPLLFHLKNLTEKVQQTLSETHDVYGAMRYGKPSFKSLLEELKDKHYEEIKVLPLFPQYATSTTESIADVLNNAQRKYHLSDSIQFVRQFYDNKIFLKAFSDRIKDAKPDTYDHIIFSYHGLPNRQVNKLHPGINAETCPCVEELPVHGKYCYKATCYHTTRLLAKQLNLPKESYTVSFQSRLSKNWLTPFTDETLIGLAKSGKKRVLIVAPSFVADCLETIIELKYEYAELFKLHGGEELTLVQSLNDSDLWVESIKMLALK